MPPPAPTRARAAFPSGPLTLEGEWLNKNGGADVVVALPPHPQHGGTLDNPVIEQAAYALANRGHPVLKLNYRGVGRSGGSWSGGNGEVDDAVAAATYALLETARPNVIYCGYSFGAWVSLEAAKRTDAHRKMILISPPNRMFGFSALVGRTDFLAVTGDRDDFCDLPALKALCGDRLAVVPGADHFYSGTLHELARRMEAFEI